MDVIYKKNVRRRSWYAFKIDSEAQVAIVRAAWCCPELGVIQVSWSTSRSRVNNSIASFQIINIAGQKLVKSSCNEIASSDLIPTCRNSPDEKRSHHSTGCRFGMRIRPYYRKSGSAYMSMRSPPWVPEDISKNHSGGFLWIISLYLVASLGCVRLNNSLPASDHGFDE